MVCAFEEEKAWRRMVLVGSAMVVVVGDDVVGEQCLVPAGLPKP